MSGLVERLRDMIPQNRALTTGERFHAGQTARDAADRIEAQDAEIARLRKDRDELAAAIDAQEVEARYSDTGNLWRFWSDKAQKYVSENRRLREALLSIATAHPANHLASTMIGVATSALNPLTAPGIPTSAQDAPSGIQTTRDSEGGA